MFSFDWPWIFLALPAPYLIYKYLPAVSNQSAALKVPFLQRIDEIESTASLSRGNFSALRMILLSMLWIALLASSAKPQWVGKPINLPSSARDLLVAVDISGSMETADMVVENQQIMRIIVVKYVLGEFLKRRESDRVGLILFGTNAYLQAPLTFDRATVNQLLQEAQLGFAGEKTAIGDAIGLAIKRLKDRPEAERVLILLTDGANTAGEVSPRQAADLAKEAGVKIYTVGVGASEMLVDRSRFSRFKRRVNPSADLDEETLNYIADTTGGLYFRAHNPEELETIYEKLDALEPVEQEKETFRPISSLFHIPLAIALFLALLLMFERVFKSSSIFITKSTTNNATNNPTNNTSKTM